MEKKCKQCSGKFKPRYNTLEMFCSSKCAYEYKSSNYTKKPVKPIRKVSKRRQKDSKTYKDDRLEFLSLPENQICFISGCRKKANTIEHRKGRLGYADDWARENNIPLLLDVRFWAGCCNEHNLELETNPELSKKYQLSKIHKGKKI